MKTKTLFILLLLLTANKYGYTQQVSKREAINAAVNTMKYLGRTNLSTENIKDIYKTENGQNTLLYEVSFKSGETILLSGHKSMKPILGYILDSNENTILNQYDNLPDGLRDFIDEYTIYAQYCFDSSFVSISNQEEWQKLQTYNRNKTIRNIVQPLTTTKWGQNYASLEYDLLSPPYYIYPYYIYESHAYNRRISDTCQPCGPDIYSPAGCASIAIAQIMYFWKYPVFNSNNVPIYDWYNMGNEISYKHRYTETGYTLTVEEGLHQQHEFRKRMDATAHLIYDCAIASETDFCWPSHNHCQSASGPYRAEEAFHYFNYNNAELKFKIFHLRYWKDLLRSDLNNGQPICYASASANINLEWDAHMYVCDGYNDDDTFSFNWGWNGEYNGHFFLLDSLPNNMDFVHCAIFNITPDDYQNPCDFTPFYYPLYNFYLEHPNETPYLITPFYFTELKSVTISEDPTGTYRTIPSNADAYYIAQEKITLRDGFHAENGSNFRAYISQYKDCDNKQRTNELNTENPPITNSNSIESNNKIIVYPNPSSNTFSIKLLEQNSYIKQISIHNIHGYELITKTYPEDNIFDISSLQNGIYIIKIISNLDEIFFHKLIKK